MIESGGGATGAAGAPAGCSRCMAGGSMRVMASRVGRMIVGVTLLLELGCGPDVSARAWPEADVLFHRDARWLGGDAAYSVDLGDERTLWLFGGSFVATSERHVRGESTMVRNSVAVQTGAVPVTACMAFGWGEGADEG